MLQDIRQNIQGTAAKIVVGLIVVSFSLFGIESILLGGSGSSVAEVNGEEITPQELQQAVNTQKRRLISMLGDNIDPAMLDDQRLSAQALEGLVGRKLMMQAATDMDLTVSEQQIGRLVGTMEQFQVDGSFSPDMYKSVLANAGYTPAYFKQSLRDDLMLNQLRSGLAGSEFATPAELALNARILAEQRDMRFMTIPMENFAIEANVDDAQIERYYQENQAEFQTPESLDIDYIELAADDLRQPVEDSALREAYEVEKETGAYATESRISHILFEDVSDARIDQARTKLAEGAEFAAVAREFSDDIGSSSTGGDLGFTAGDTFPPQMEEAIAELELGVVSGPVETDAGVHLILVTERKEGKVPEFEEMRAQLEDRLQLEEARVTLLRTVENLRDLSFNAEDLDGPAAELDLTVERANAVTRTQTEGLFANASLVAAAFSEDVLEAGHNSEVMELSDNRFVVLRVRRHNKPEALPLAAVRDEIAATLADQAARAAVASQAQNAVAALRSGTGVEEFATDNGFEWQAELGVDRGNTAVPREVLQRAFQLPPPAAGESVTEYVMTANGDALVFELLRVSAGQLDALAEAEQAGLRQRLTGESSGLLDNEFQRGLRTSADISVM